MKIDITDSDVRELMNICQQFPHAIVTASGSHAFLEISQVVANPVQHGGSQRPKQSENKFMNMFNALGDAF